MLSEMDGEVMTWPVSVPDVAAPSRLLVKKLVKKTICCVASRDATHARRKDCVRPQTHQSSFIKGFTGIIGSGNRLALGRTRLLRPVSDRAKRHLNRRHNVTKSAFVSFCSPTVGLFLRNRR